MDEIVKEELWRSVAVFFFAFLFTGIVTTKFDLSASFFTVIVVPLLITISHFMITIYLRREESYNPKKLSAKFAAGFMVLLSAIFILLWLMGISLREDVSGESFISLGLYVSLLVISLIWYCKVKGGEREQC